MSLIDFLLSPTLWSALAFSGTIYLMFWKSYFSERGKILATKQDIDKITHTVEEIKTEFIRGTERMKVELQYTSQWKYSIKTEEKNAIVGCYDAYQVWLNSMMTFSLYDYDETNYLELKECQKEMMSLYKNYLLAEGKYDLYVTDKVIDKLLAELKEQTLELYRIVGHSCVEHTYSCRGYNLTIKDIKDKQMDFKEQQEQINKETADLLDSQFTLIEKYDSKKSELYKKIAAKLRMLQITSYKRLLEIDKAFRERD